MKITKILTLMALMVLSVLSVSAFYDDSGYSRFNTFGRAGTIDFGRGAFDANSLTSSLDQNSLNADFSRNDFTRTFSGSDSLDRNILEGFLRDYSNTGSSSFREGYDLSVGDCSDPKAATFRDKVKVTVKEDYGSSNFFNSGNKNKKTYVIQRKTCDGLKGNIFRDVNVGNSFSDNLIDGRAFALLSSSASSEDISDSSFGRALNFDQSSLSQTQSSTSFSSFGRGNRLVLNRYL